MNKNTQPRSKADYQLDGSLLLHHLFHSIQGEGPFAGRPAIFIRLAGCVLQCPLCDTDYTSGAYRVTVTTLVGMVELHGANVKNLRGHLIVITGGEPFRQNLTPLVEALLLKGYEVQIESNGTVMCPGFRVLWEDTRRVVVVLSPKTGGLNPDAVACAGAFKYVVGADAYDPTDGLPTSALGNVGPPPCRPPPTFPNERIYIQPLDTGDQSDNARHRSAAIRSSLRFGYRLCLQLHKLIDLE